MNVSPDLFRWMLFVDGENFTIQGEKVAQENGIKLGQGNYYWPKVFLWLHGAHPYGNIFQHGPWIQTQGEAFRCYYYTSLVGNDEEFKEVKVKLQKVGFMPKVFIKKKGTEKSKGVDIALTIDVLNHAYLNHYHSAVLIAGDKDYLPLIEQVQRLGKNVYVSFFGSEGYGLSEDLRVSANYFHDITQDFLHTWKGHKVK